MAKSFTIWYHTFIIFVVIIHYGFAGKPGVDNYCWSCKNVASEDECAADGIYKKCSSPQTACFLLTHTSTATGRTKISRGCAPITVCDNAALASFDQACHETKQGQSTTVCISCEFAMTSKIAACDAACEEEETCISGVCIRQAPVCDPPCTDTDTDREICDGENECVSTVCDTTCSAPEECMVGYCVDVATAFPFTPPFPQVCAAFDNCADYINGCEDCEYDPETGVTRCETLDADACDPLSPPASQCIQCVQDFELSDIEGDTCCVAVISDEVRMKTLAAVEASMMGLDTPIDADQDGFISRQEFDDNILVRDADAYALFNMIDTNGDGLLSEGERQASFLVLYAQMTEMTEMTEMTGLDVIEGRDAGAVANGDNSVPDMFGIEDTTPTETYSILTLIIIVAIVVLVVFTCGVYQYAQKKKALKELNQIEDNQDNNECDPVIDEKPLYEPEVVSQTRD